MGDVMIPVVGQRVTLKRDVERFPHFIARAGLTGTVSTSVAGEFLSVRMDAPLDGAEDWDNEVQWIDADMDWIGGDLEVTL